jgi:hypothetical protein
MADETSRMLQKPKLFKRVRARRKQASPRRVIYSSWWARGVRVAVGLGFLGATLWLALPVLRSEHGPPRPTGLFVGLNTPRFPPPRESTLYLTIRDNDCKNPATVEGLFERPNRSWQGDGRTGPTEAEVVLADAEVTEADAGLAVLGEQGAGRELEAPVFGYFESPILNGTETVTLASGRQVTVHDSLEKLLHTYHPPGYPALGAVVVRAPQWAEVRAPLHFILTANLVRPLGFHRCYVDVPALLSSGGGIDNKPVLEAYSYTFHEALLAGLIHPARGEPPAEEPGFRDIAEVSHAEVTVFVSGHVIDGASVGAGVTDIPNGVHYVCATKHGSPASVNSTCAGTPVFEVPGREAEITRRIFLAGILGAIGLTLIIEALFVGETASLSRGQREA